MEKNIDQEIKAVKKEINKLKQLHYFDVKAICFSKGQILQEKLNVLKVCKVWQEEQFKEIENWLKLHIDKDLGTNYGESSFWEEWEKLK